MDGIADEIVDLIEGPAQQAQERLARFAVASPAQDMKPAEQQQTFIVGQELAIRSSLENGAQFRRGFFDPRRTNRDGEIRKVCVAIA